MAKYIITVKQCRSGWAWTALHIRSNVLHDEGVAAFTRRGAFRSAKRWIRTQERAGARYTETYEFPPNNERKSN